MAYQVHSRNKRRQIVVFGTIAAAVVTVAVQVALWKLFNSASRTPWLAAGAVNEAQLQGCDRHRHTAARHACVERVVAEVRRRASDVAVARSASQAAPR